MLDYTFTASIQTKVPLSAMSIEDRIRLCKDLAEGLLVRRDAKRELRIELRNFLAEVIDLSE